MSSGPEARRRVALVVALVALACAGESGSAPSGDRARYDGRAVRFARVIDGDTAVLADGTSVRYIGIDTPEAHPPQCGAAAATRANRERILGRDVVLELDPAETRDRYGRLLAYLEVDGSLLNVELVRSGLACAFPYGRTRLHRAEIAAAERDARAAGRGVWSGCPRIPEGCPPAGS